MDTKGLAGFKTYCSAILTSSRKNGVKNPWFDRGIVAFTPVPTIMSLNDWFNLCHLVYRLWQKYPAEEDYKENDGWFPVSLDQMQKWIDNTPDQQFRFLNKMEKLELVSRKRVGNKPPARWLKIHYETFNKVIENAQRERQQAS